MFICMEGKLLSRILLGTALLLTIVNMVMLVSLLNAKRQLAEFAAQAGTVLQEVQSQTSGALFTANIAIDKTISLPIKIRIPVQTSVDVPVQIPVLGQVITVTVPINTTVPIDTVVQIPIKTSIPVSVTGDNFPLGDILQKFVKLLAGSLE